jgi:hypothetical protein
MENSTIDVNMISFPFVWTSEVTSADFDDKAYARFLDRNGIGCEGIWQREVPADQPLIAPYGKLDISWNPFVLPAESVILETAVTEMSTLPTLENMKLRAWKDYYVWRGFRLDSIICILLQWPLTIFYILQHCLPVDYPNAKKVDVVTECDANLVIHCVGATKEADLIPTFVELTVLLPRVNFDLHLIGPMLSKTISGQYRKPATRLTVTLHSALYHSVYSSLPKPDGVIGFNAGLVAYTSWIETLRLLASVAIPSYFTEYCMKSYELTREQIDRFGRHEWQRQKTSSEGMQQLGHQRDLAYDQPVSLVEAVNCTDVCLTDDQQTDPTKCWTVSVSEARLNPFRSPIRIYDPQTDFPAFSNAVLFCLRY